jgi:hypothetical protein
MLADISQFIMRPKKGIVMNGKDKLVQYWNEKPVETLVVGALVATAVSKLIDSLSAVQGRRAYARQVNYRARKQR